MIREQVPVPVEAPRPPENTADVSAIQDTPLTPPAAKDVQDPYDVFGARLRGTTFWRTRAGLTTIPAAVSTIVAEGTGGISVITSATVAEAGILALTGAVYAGKRLTENGRASKRLESQQALSDGLGEPVNLMQHRVGGRKGRKQTTLRWFGADTAFQDEDAPASAERFKKIVDYADDNKITHVAFSSRLLPQDTPERSWSDYRDNYVTDTPTLFSQTKGTRVTDSVVDDELIKLPTAEAVKLAEALPDNKAETPSKYTMDVIAEALLAKEPDHPIGELYKLWQKERQTADSKVATSTAVKAAEKHLAHLTEAMTIKLHQSIATRAQREGAPLPGKRLVMDGEGEYFAGPRRLEPSVTMHGDGIHVTGSSSALGDIPLQRTEMVSFRELAGGDPTELVDDLTDHIINRPSENGLHPDKLELALHHITRDEVLANKQVDASAQTREPANQSEVAATPTYDRVVAERPRTFLTGKLRREGVGTRGERTLQYRRLKRQSIGVKVGALAAGVAIGVGVGAGVTERWNAQIEWLLACDPQYGSDISKCDNRPLPTFGKEAGNISKGVFNVTDAVENATIEQLFRSGLISEDFIRRFSSVDYAWIARKRDQLEVATNMSVQDGSLSIGDADPGGNPAVWTLNPVNGAKTDGYWTEALQHDLLIGDSYILAGQGTPPLTHGSVYFEADHLNTAIEQEYYDKQPDKTLYNSIGRPVRLTNVPAQPVNTGQQLISVGGRQLINDRLGLITENGDHQQNFGVIHLPVTQGGDVVAASATLKTLSTDKVVKTLNPPIFQNIDGTFGALIDEQGAPDRGYADDYYVEIQYWVEPDSKNPALKPVQAMYPMQVFNQAVNVDQAKGASGLLQSVLSPEDTKALTDSLGVPPTANLDEIAAAIHRKHGYSFTPYADVTKKGVAHINIDPGLASTNDTLMAVAKYLQAAPDLNCNTSMLLAVIASRGDANGAADEPGRLNATTFLNSENGYHNNGDNILSRVESHAYLRKGKEIIDPTPSITDQNSPAAQTMKQQPQQFQPSPESHSDRGLLLAEMLLGAISMGVGFPLGKKYAQPLSNSLVHYGQKKYVEHLTAALESPQSAHDAALLNHLLYGPNQPLDEAALPKHVTNAEPVDAQRMAQNFGVADPKAMRQRIKEATADNRVTLSAGTVRRLMKLTSRSDRYRKVRPTDNI